MQLAETKSANTVLATDRLLGESSKDLATVVQPVVQLASVAHRFEQEPFVLFYATKEMVRPFIYYRSCDVMLAPSSSERWMNVKENKIELEGMVMMAVLMQSSKLFNMTPSPVGKKFDKTGFHHAIETAGESAAYSAAALKPQAIHEEQHLSSRKRQRRNPPSGIDYSEEVCRELV